jgi:hypothetical protein
VKSVDQIQFEAALALGSQCASEPDDNAGGGALVQMTRAQANVRLQGLDADVDKIVDRILVLREQGRTKRADRLYRLAVTKCAAAQDLREALDFGSISRVMS